MSEAPELTPARHLPARDLPAYRHLPGVTPHPLRDPRGHSWPPEPAAAVCLEPPELWRQDTSYLWGVDLYNCGYYWEAHESWEACWRGCREDALAAGYLQGLIQVASAWLRLRMGSPAAARRIAERGLARLEKVARAQPLFMGLALRPWLASVRRLLDAAATTAPPLCLQPGPSAAAQSDPESSDSAPR